MTSLPDAEELLDRLAGELTGLLERRGVDDPVLVGIHTGGMWVAERLAERLGYSRTVGALDIGFHRDDYADRGLPGPPRPTRLDDGIDGGTVVLVDDVLHSGRTVRAALNAIFEYGRPRAVILAVLVDRGGRQLPIQADVAAARLELPPDRRVKLSGPSPLVLAMQEPGS